MASITLSTPASSTSDATAYPSPKHDSNGHASYGKNKTDYSEDTPPGLLFKLDLSNLVPSNKPKVTGDEKTHVFYLMGASPFCRAEQAPMDIQVIIPVGPIQIYLTGRVEFVNKTIDMPTYIRFPLRPDTLIGRFTGSLQDNTTTFESTITINELGPIVTGSLKLVLAGSSVQVHEQHARKWVILQGDITVLETQYEFDVKVFPWAGIDTHTSLNFEAAAR